MRDVILKKLIHHPGLSFNQLWGRDGESNKFAYHLKVLETDGLLKKSGSGYELTHLGKKVAAYVDGDSGKKSEFPIMGVIVVVEKDGKYLMLQRQKEPFYGYWGFVGGKLKFSQYLMEAAADELKEETGLECDLELKGLFSSKTYNDDSLSYSHQMFIVKGTNPRGKLLSSTREGINRWIPFAEIRSMKTFPNILKTIEIIQCQGFRWLEADRLQKDDEFIDMRIIRDKVF